MPDRLYRPDANRAGADAGRAGRKHCHRGCTTEGEEVYPDAQPIASPIRTIRETVELGQDDVEPEPLSCPVCGGETARQQKIELGEWCTLYTEACPQERMGCLHAIQERSVLCYDRCEDCGEVAGRHFLQQRDAGCFTGNDLR